MIFDFCLLSSINTLNLSTKFIIAPVIASLLSIVLIFGSISKDEAVCNVHLAQGKTIGCFYIESPAMRGLLRRLNCDNYKILVAASSIIRPGVAQSGMMKEYIFRHNNPTQFEYFHEVFKMDRPHFFTKPNDIFPDCLGGQTFDCISLRLGIKRSIG